MSSERTMPADVLTIRPGALTPCCSRVPLAVRDGVWGCRACGTLYRDAAAVVRAVFGGAVDVTALAPTRLIPRMRWHVGH